MKKFILSLLILATPLWSQVLSSKTSLSRLYIKEARSLNDRAILKKSLLELKDFTTSDLDTPRDNDKKYAKYISIDEARDVKYAAMNNPVVASHQTSKYDPNNKGIGFCFGRAMFVNIDLAFRKFDRDSIKKAFVIGSMETPDGASWGWHVTTIVKSINRRGQVKWLAIDPIVNSIVTVKQWYEEMYQNYSTDKKLRLYITEAGKFGPSAGSYHHKSLTNKFYNNYFTDMLDWFKKENKSGAYDNNSIRVKKF